MASDDFHAVYEKHVAHVARGDLQAAMGDIAEETLPAIFDGVDVPKGTVDSFDVVGTRADGERSIGETVYHTPRGSIGLRSTWSRRGNTWKAVALENFPAAEGA